jgi:hypothetical protein
MPTQLLQLGGADLLRAAGAAQPPGQAVLVVQQVGGGAVALELERVGQIDGHTPAPPPRAPRATPTAGGRPRSGSAPWPVDEEYANDDGGEAE